MPNPPSAKRCVCASPRADATFRTARRAAVSRVWANGGPAMSVPTASPAGAAADSGSSHQPPATS
ncbi:hypothetical protein ACL02R_15745 [Streptomyces sp. MS19]|uniref:hypothetical protein n=1 Tax=Streptomyces sp. MS19 TaxID=3385972 RepID=UPI0039A2E888